MSEPRRLKFHSIDDALAEIGRLRSGKHTQLRNWSLPMMAWHVSIPLRKYTTPPTDPVPTPEQAARKAAFVDVVLSTAEASRRHHTTARDDSAGRIAPMRMWNGWWRRWKNLKAIRTRSWRWGLLVRCRRMNFGG